MQHSFSPLRSGCQAPGTDLPAAMWPPPLSPASNMSLADCEGACVQVPQCRGLAFNAREGKCRLKRVCAGRAGASHLAGSTCQPRNPKKRWCAFARTVSLPAADVTRASAAADDDDGVAPAPSAVPWTRRDWEAAFARLPPREKAPPAGILYLHLGPWPPWLRYLVASAAANSRVAFYFLGPHIDFFGPSFFCGNCAWLPLDAASVLQRVEQHLGLPRASVRLSGRKICDYKPMWPALLPELSERHQWIGYADPDVLFGNLSAEVERLRLEDDMLVPLERFPQPLSNGNFMLYRSTTRVLQAFRRMPTWQRTLQRSTLLGFDEWSTDESAPSIFVAYQDMLLSGQLRARPAHRLFVQDAVIIQGRMWPTLDSFQASVNFTWRGGALLAERRGPCVCPRDSIPQFGITVCPECLDRPGEVLPGVPTHRRLEVLAVHFQAWKKRWRSAMRGRGGGGGGGRGGGAAAAGGGADGVETPWPVCQGGGAFTLRPAGFRCGA